MDTNGNSNGNGRNADDIRELGTILNEFRVDIAEKIGALTTSHTEMKESLREFKGNVQKDLEDHEKELKKHDSALNQQRGGLKVFGWVGSFIATADILYHWLKK